MWRNKESSYKSNRWGYPLVAYTIFRKREHSSNTSINHPILNLLLYKQKIECLPLRGLISWKSIDCPHSHGESLIPTYFSSETEIRRDEKGKECENPFFHLKINSW